MIAALAERPPRPVSCLFSLANQGTNIVEVPALFRGAVMGICFVEDPICTYCVESPMMCMCMDICEWETCDRYIPLACMSCVIVSITLVGLTDATIPTLARRSHRQCGRQCSFVLCKSQITPAQFRRQCSFAACLQSRRYVTYSTRRTGNGDQHDRSRLPGRMRIHVHVHVLNSANVGETGRLRHDAIRHEAVRKSLPGG